MDFIIILLVFAGLGFLFFTVLPAILPVLLIVFVLVLARNLWIQYKRKKFFEDTFSDMNQDTGSHSTFSHTSQNSRSKNPDAIDVEDTEREDEGEEQ